MSYGKALLKPVKDESAQDLIEYALVAALIALGAVVSMRTLATTISTCAGKRRHSSDKPV
jgi:pilus assembly protein Flp/PilA